MLRDSAAVFVCYSVSGRLQSGRRSNYSAGGVVTAGPVQVGACEIRGRRAAQWQMSTAQVHCMLIDLM